MMSKRQMSAVFLAAAFVHDRISGYSSCCRNRDRRGCGNGRRRSARKPKEPLREMKLFPQKGTLMKKL